MDATVKWWSNSKGYGFATLQDGREVFCHYTQVEPSVGGFKSLKAGQKIELDLYETVKGLEGKNIRHVA